MYVTATFLTTVTIGNPNRDDLNQPKTAMIGDRLRLRLSAQSLKAAWRTASLFQEPIGDGVFLQSPGLRTRYVGVLVVERLVADHKMSIGQAVGAALPVMIALGATGKPKKKRGKAAVDADATGAGETVEEEVVLDGTLVGLTKDHITALELPAVGLFVAREIARMVEVARECAAGTRKKVKAADVLVSRTASIDVTLFGRMFASASKFNREAAMALSHAFTTHEAVIEDDFLTAREGLTLPEPFSHNGAGHMGNRAFGSGVFHYAATFNIRQLLDGLDWDRGLAAEALARMLRAMATTLPSGHRSAMASHSWARYGLVEVFDKCPRTYEEAFLNPISAAHDPDLLKSSIERIRQVADEDATQLGGAKARAELVAAPGMTRTGSIDALIACAVSAV